MVKWKEIPAIYKTLLVAIPASVSLTALGVRSFDIQAALPAQVAAQGDSLLAHTRRMDGLDSVDASLRRDINEWAENQAISICLHVATLKKTPWAECLT